jgi:hypothetical protein
MQQVLIISDTRLIYSIFLSVSDIAQDQPGKFHVRL